MPETSTGNVSILNAQIKSIVKDLSSAKLDLPKIRELSKSLHDIYAQNPSYRHEYSSITSVLVYAIRQQNNADIAKEDQTKKVPIDTIIEANLSGLKQDFQKQYPYKEEDEVSQNVSKQFHKLYDHIMLESVRLNYMGEIKSDLHTLSETQDQINNLGPEIKSIQDDVNTAKSSYITQVVSVLSIFAAIVITFSGGLTLLGSGFSAIQKSQSPFRLLFLFGLFGFIMYNAIIGLMFIVCRMNRKDIGVACKIRSSCYGCPNNKSSLWGILCQGVHKYPHILAVEFTFIYFMYLIFVCWSFTTSNKEIFPQILHQGNYVAEIILILIPFIVLCLNYYRRIIRNFFSKITRKRRKKKKEKKLTEIQDSILPKNG